MSARVSALAAASMVALSPVAADAHPHVFIDVSVEVRFDADGRAVGLQQVWSFDEIFTAYVTEGMDLDGDGAPDHSELAAMAEENLTNLEEWGYFTEVRRDDERVEVVRAEGEPTVRVDGSRLEMGFELTIAEPIDMKASAMAYAIYDPTYYVDMLHAETDDAIRLAGAPAACNHSLIEPTPDPEMVEYAASLGVDESGGNSLGEIFAEWVFVRCTPGS